MSDPPLPSKAPADSAPGEDPRAEMQRLLLRGEVDAGFEFSRRTRELALAEGDRALAAEAAHRMGEMLLEADRDEEALAILRAALEERERLLGADHPLTASTRSSVAWALWSLGSARAARETLDKALGDLPTNPPDDQRAAVAAVLANAGGIASGRDEDSTAVTFYRRALAVYEGGGTPEPLEIASLCVSLSSPEEQEGRLDEARALLDRALALRRAALGDEHLYIAYTLDHLAGNVLGKGDLDEARRLYEQGAAMIERCRGAAHHSLATPLAGLATIAAMRKDAQTALGFARRAVAISEASFGPTSHRVAQQVAFLAMLQATVGRSPTAAAPLWRRAAELWLPVHAAHADGLGQCFANLALCLRAEGRYREFLEFAGPAYQRLDRDPDAASVLLATLANALSEAYFEEGRSQDALGLLQRALVTMESREGPSHPDLAPILSNLAQVLRSLGRAREARECERRIKKVRRRGAWN